MLMTDTQRSIPDKNSAEAQDSADGHMESASKEAARQSEKSVKNGTVSSDTNEAHSAPGAGSAVSDDDATAGEVRAALTINEAATILGRSVRAINDAITGKWGNHFPRVGMLNSHENGVDSWRIIPPETLRSASPILHRTRSTWFNTNQVFEESKMSLQSVIEPLEIAAEQIARSLIQDRSQPKRHPTAVSSESDRTTIVIDRSDDVEALLRELQETQRALADEMRQHIEDLRLLNQLQSSMRLIESNSSETQKLKAELIEAQKEVLGLKRDYEEFLQLPWWKRLWRRFP